MSAGACASSPAALPVAASQPSPYADVVPFQVNGHPGVWMEEQAFQDILVGIVREKGDLKIELVQQKIETWIAETRAKALEKIAKGSAWREIFVPIITFVSGVVLTTVGILGGIYAGQALHAAP